MFPCTRAGVCVCLCVCVCMCVWVGVTHASCDTARKFVINLELCAHSLAWLWATRRPSNLQLALCKFMLHAPERLPLASGKYESYSCAAACAYLLSLATATLVFQFGRANGLLCVSHACHGTTRRQTVTSAVMWRRQQLIDPLLPQLTAHVVRKRIIGDQLPLINGTLNVQRSMRCAVSSHLGDSADSNDLSIATAKATDRRH